MRPQIAPVPGRNKGYLKIVLRLGYAQRRQMAARQPEDLFVEPRLMAELKRRAELRRQQREKGGVSRMGVSLSCHNQSH